MYIAELHICKLIIESLMSIEHMFPSRFVYFANYQHLNLTWHLFRLQNPIFKWRAGSITIYYLALTGYKLKNVLILIVKIHNAKNSTMTRN